MVQGLFMCSERCFALTFPKFVVERGPIGQMMHAGFSRWMAGAALTCLILGLSTASFDILISTGDQESSLSHYITAGVAGLEIAQVDLPVFLL